MQSSCAIITNCSHIYNMLHLKYGKYLSEEETATQLHVEAVKYDPFYRIATEDESFVSRFPIREIDRYLFQNTKYNDNIFAIHGGAIEYGNNAYIFLSPTLGGKTTLTSYLSAQGCDYITDDCILLDKINFNVYPYTTPIHLRQGGIDILSAYYSAPEDLREIKDGSEVQRFVYTPKNCVNSAIPLKRIFFIERTENENRLVQMNATERIAALMKSPITDYEINGEYIRFLSKLAKYECHILKYSDMNYVKDIIQNG